MDQWALLRIGGNLFRLRIRRDWSEPRVVAEAVGETTPPGLDKFVTKAANQDFPEHEDEYIPHTCLAVATALAKRLHGEVVDYSRPRAATTEEERLTLY